MTTKIFVIICYFCILNIIGSEIGGYPINNDCNHVNNNYIGFNNIGRRFDNNADGQLNMNGVISVSLFRILEMPPRRPTSNAPIDFWKS